jgi:hypothetical protein
MARPAYLPRVSFVSLLFLAASASGLFIHSFTPLFQINPNGSRRGLEAQRSGRISEIQELTSLSSL